MKKGFTGMWSWQAIRGFDKSDFREVLSMDHNLHKEFDIKRIPQQCSTSIKPFESN
jgi:hypothetical protein